jgi:hypothetical protein
MESGAAIHNGEIDAGREVARRLVGNQASTVTKQAAILAVVATNLVGRSTVQFRESNRCDAR